MSSNGGGGHGGGAPSAAEAKAQEMANTANMVAAEQLGVILLAVAGALVIYNVVAISVRYIRRLTTMNNDSQKYFAQGNAFSEVKRLLINAPLVTHRQSRPLSLGPVNMGTVPSRMPTILLLSLVGLDVYYLAKDLKIPLQTQALSSLYNRAATLSLTNAIPLFLFAGRKNPLITLQGIDFNSFNTMHRWIGRLTVSLILIHAITWVYYVAEKGGAQAVSNGIFKTEFITHGFGAIVCLVSLVVLAGPYLRKAFYETFLLTHQLLVVASLVLIYLHTRKYWQNRLVLVLMAIWAVDRGLRLLNLLMNNVGRQGTKILTEILPGEAMRITIYAARPFDVRPGSHLYLYLPSVGLWTSHPFSIAWTDRKEVFQEPDQYEVEKGGLVVTSRSVVSETSMSLVVRKRGGMTAMLYKKAEKNGGRLSCRAMIEGPYGGLHGLDSYGTVLLFAGGVGITHQVAQVRHLVAGFTDRSVACRKLVLVWAVQSSGHLEWVRPWMTEVLGMPGRRDVLRVMIFVTRPDPRNPSGLDVQSPSQSVQMFPGRRPDVASIIDAEATNQIGAMAISVCGGGSMSDDVRVEARKRQQFGNVDLFDEAFSW